MLSIKNNLIYFLPIIAGGLLILSSPIFDFGWLSFFALVPFLFFLELAASASSGQAASASLGQAASANSGRAKGKKTAFWGGALLGFVYFLGVLYPLTSIDWWGFRGDGPVSQKIFLFAGWPIFAIFGSLFFAAASLLFFELRRKNSDLETRFPSRLFSVNSSLGNLASLASRDLAKPDKYRDLFLFPAIFVLLTEFLRSIFIFNFTWGFLGYSLHNVFYLQQLAAFGGVYLLSFIVYFFNAAIFRLVFSHLEAMLPSWRVAVKGAGIVVFLFLFLNFIGFNYYALMKEKIGAVKEEKTVAVLQGNIKQSRILPGDELNIEEPYLKMIDEALAKNADILVLPESVVPGNITFISDGGDYFSESGVILKGKIENFLKEKFREKDILAVFGVGVLKNEKNYNALVYADVGGIFGKYFKRYLVPFGEYRPAIAARIAPKSLFQRTPGIAPMIVEKNGVKFGSLICQEAMYPGLWRDSVLAGANVLINAGNDGIFGSEKAARIMGIMAKTRAIESGRYVIRAMKTGVSAVFEPTGNEIARAEFNASALLFAKIRPLEGLTLYVRLGNWILILSAAGVALRFLGWYNKNRK